MTSPQISLDGSRLRLNTTIRLRWFAVAGQTATILLIYYGFGFPLPFGLSLALILMSAVLNIGLSITYPRSQLLLSRHAMLLLGYDILQLAGLLYLTGGLENPFAFLLVVPVAVSASTQPLTVTAGLTVFDIALATALAYYHMPLPWAHELPPVLPLNYLFGLWSALVSCTVFIAIYAWRIGQEARQMSQALTAAELVLAREQRLAALDGLAAAAAHQLGTPLSTISLVAKELEREVPKESPWREDIMLLQTQAVRCRDILSELSKSGRDGEGEKDYIFSQMPLSHLLEEVAAPLRAPGIEIDVKLTDEAPLPKSAGEPVIPRNPGLIHSLGNLVENAVEFANEHVTIDAHYDQDTVRLRICDDGPGFQANVINQLGSPYVTSRPRGNGSDEEAGMGLGFFIAKTLLERSGASLRAANRPPPGTGAMVEIEWPRQRLESSE
ncbi:MAG: ActS/PrrB/RegB family redox-sensitive histidine kinase [Rhodomicrobium sp.]|nr:ActS/PrrB/RegB family redox-sensitive histidine kinase [Rhodomicrobium sp.]